MLKYFASIPIVLSVIAGAYGTLNYIYKLTTQFDNCADTIALLQVEVENLEQRVYGDMDNIHAIFNDKTGRNSQAYTEARAELVRFSQGTNQVNFSAEDFAAAIERPVAEVLALPIISLYSERSSLNSLSLGLVLITPSSKRSAL